MKSLLIKLTIVTSLVIPITAQADVLRDNAAAENVFKYQLPEAKKKLASCLAEAGEDYEVDSVYLKRLESVSLKMVKQCKKEVYRLSQLKTFIWLHLADNCRRSHTANVSIWADTPECQKKEAYETKYF
ncbi:MAG: hypothetical protein WBB19_13075 [Desulforhopalus sp.]